MLINYIDEKGTISKLYEKAFSGGTGETDYVMDENDPRYILRKKIEEEEWERFKQRHKIPIAIYPDKEIRGKQYEEEKKLPYNPDLIVVPEDPKEKTRVKRDIIVKLSGDIPRRDHMFIYKRPFDTYLDTLTTNIDNTEDFDKIMVLYNISYIIILTNS